MNIFEIIVNAFESPVNIAIVGSIIVLAIIDIRYKKDLKSQIVSLGVLGTFIGIFIGLQNFNPADMKNSIDGILLGLKTAFFTSIIGMGVALILTIREKIYHQEEDNHSQEENLLIQISEQLQVLENIDKNTKDDTVLLQQLRLMSQKMDILEDIYKESKDHSLLIEISEKLNHLEAIRQENQNITTVIERFEESSSTEMNILVSLLEENFEKNISQEIIEKLENIISNFSQKFETNFGDTIVQLNESIIHLITWQQNYKSHIASLEERLILSTNAIDTSKDTLKLISSKNKEILSVYEALSEMINTSQTQISTLNNDLNHYAHLSNDAKAMFSSIENNLNTTSKAFQNLTQQIINSHIQQKESFQQIPKSLEEAFQQLNKNLSSLDTKFDK